MPHAGSFACAEKNKMNKLLHRILFSLLVVLTLFSLVHLLGYYKQLLFMGAVVAMGGVLIVFGRDKCSAICRRANYIILPLFVVWASVVLFWESWGKCRAPEVCRDASYAMGKILVLMPHQDDESNCLGGVLKELNSQGEVYILFANHGNDEPRWREAQRAAAQCGIPEERVIFLGYASMWNVQEPKKWGEPFLHLYNVQNPDDLVTSYPGEIETRGRDGIECYAPGTLFTRNNYKKNLKSVVESIRPDTIICIDYDINPDHRALSLFFDEVMKSIRSRDSFYSPFILKSFAYSTSWLAEKDFYGINMLSARKPMNEAYMQEVNCYDWSERLRLPVGAESVTRILAGNSARESFMEHVSQWKQNKGVEEAMVNADHVFWWRPAGNLLHQACIAGDGANVEHLTDFKLYDSTDVTRFDKKPYDHGWLPGREGAKVSFSLNEPSVIKEIRLYDHIDTANQIKRLTIRLSNGRQITTRALPPNGRPLVVQTGCEEVIDGFELTVEEMHGVNPGISEVEVFAESPTPPISVIKLKDAEDNFMYDYIVPEEGKVSFSLYTWPDVNAFNNYSVFVVNTKTKQEKKLSWSHDKSEFSLSVSSGDELLLEVRDARGLVHDAALVRNPGSMMRSLYSLQQKLDVCVRNRTKSSQLRFYRRWKDFMLRKITS